MRDRVDWVFGILTGLPPSEAVTPKEEGMDEDAGGPKEDSDGSTVNPPVASAESSFLMGVQGLQPIVD